MGMMINSDQSDDDVIGTINTTPLVDIMLVLLIIFLITVPVVTHTVPVKLPEEKIRLMPPHHKIFSSQSIKLAIFFGMNNTLQIKKPCLHVFKLRRKNALNLRFIFVATNLHIMRRLIRL